MKIQCNMCEVAEASVLCCAEETALCVACDATAHAANNIASMHQRVSLENSSSPMPKCDVCQETNGLIFCLADRALLCRICDAMVHTANAHVGSHQRYLLTGVKLGLEPAHAIPNASSSAVKLNSAENIPQRVSPVAVQENAMPAASKLKGKMPLHREVTDLDPGRDSFPENLLAGDISQWDLDELLGLLEADIGKHDSNPSLSSIAENPNVEHLGEVPDNSWAVPQIPSLPSASGSQWPNISQNPYGSMNSVPDSAFQNDSFEEWLRKQ